jgi:hypothetical protein
MPNNCKRVIAPWSQVVEAEMALDLSAIRDELGPVRFEYLRQMSKKDRQDFLATVRTFLRSDGVEPQQARVMVAEFEALLRTVEKQGDGKI